MIDHPSGTLFMYGFQLSNKKSLKYTYFKLDNFFLSMFNLYINITSQGSLNFVSFIFYGFI